MPQARWIITTGLQTTTNWGISVYVPPAVEEDEEDDGENWITPVPLQLAEGSVQIMQAISQMEATLTGFTCETSIYSLFLFLGLPGVS
jgi:hypothetical protein